MSKDLTHTFAIGDVHGCCDLLKVMLESIRLKAVEKDFSYRVVFLGDIIDRGPDSRGAMDLVIATLRDVPGSKLVLGNHESLLLRVFDGGDEKIFNWMNAGGDTALQSYGYPAGKRVTAKGIRQMLGDEHIACMREAEHYVELDQHVLVHAGIRPGTPLAQQDPYDLMWIREGFLDFVGSFDKTVVHGHTPTMGDDVEVWPNRIAVDTCAYESDVLSAVQIMPSGEVSVMQAVSVAGGLRRYTVEVQPRQMSWQSIYKEAGLKLGIRNGIAVMAD